MTIEKQIDRNNAINYIEKQIFSVMPSIHNSSQISIKLQSKNGATNWLNISNEDCRQIEQLLINSYLKRGV